MSTASQRRSDRSRRASFQHRSLVALDVYLQQAYSIVGHDVVESNHRDGATRLEIGRFHDRGTVALGSPEMRGLVPRRSSRFRPHSIRTDLDVAQA